MSVFVVIGVLLFFVAAVAPVLRPPRRCTGLGHHWHLTGFVSWECCHCVIDVDGNPKGQAAKCARRVET